MEKSNRYAFQSYAWGVWVTALAQLLGDRFVYCDTDSVKYLDIGSAPIGRATTGSDRKTASTPARD